MKKKFFAMYALAGALVASPVFTSCVDSEESASVENIRNQKAEQLKSLAALNNAEAQAKTTLAAADAALKAAQAAQQQALADKYAAEAKIAELEAQLKADKYDAELAAALAQAEANKVSAEQSIAYYQAQMQKNAIDLEAALLRLEKDLLEAQDQLNDKIDELAKEDAAAAEAKYAELKELAGVYADRLNLHNSYSLAVSKKEIALAEVKADTITWKEAQAEAIAERENAIALAEMQIEALKKYTNYTEDIEALKAELEAAKAAMNLADDKANAATKVVVDLKNAANNNKTLAELKEAYQEALKAVEVKNWFEVLDENENQIGYTYFSYFEDNKPYKYAFEDGKLATEANEYDYPKYLNLEVAYVADLAAVKHNLDLELLSLDIAGKKAAIETAETGFQALYDAAKKTADAKKAAYEAAAAADKATAEAEWRSAVSNMETAQANLETAKQNLAVAEDLAAQLNATYAIISDAKSCDALVAAAKAYNDEWTKVYTEIATAEDAAQVAAEAAAEALVAYNTLEQVLNGDSYTTNQYVGDMSIWDFFNQQSRFSYGGSWELYNVYVYDSEGNAVFDPITGEHLYVQESIDAWDYWNRGYEWLSRLMFEQYEEVVVYSENGALNVTVMIEALEEAIETANEEIENLKKDSTREEEIARQELEIEGMKNILEAMKLELDATKVKMDALKAELTAAE